MPNVARSVVTMVLMISLARLGLLNSDRSQHWCPLRFEFFGPDAPIGAPTTRAMGLDPLIPRSTLSCCYCEDNKRVKTFWDVLEL